MLNYWNIFHGVEFLIICENSVARAVLLYKKSYRLKQNLETVVFETRKKELNRMMPRY